MKRPALSKTPGKRLNEHLIRIMSIVKLLQDNRRVFTREMAQRFGVSLRTIQRDMNILEAAGYAIYSKPICGQGLWYWKKV